MLQEVYALEGAGLWTAASGFGGGVGRLQSICGALAGGTIALGLLEARTVEDPKRTADAVRPKVRRLVQGFQERFGAIDCRALTGFDFNVSEGPEGYEAFKRSSVKRDKCHQYVRYVVETLTNEA